MEPYHFRLKLQDLLKKHGLTQARLAAEIGMDAQRLSDLLHGRWKRLYRHEVERLLAFFGCDFDELFEAFRRDCFFSAYQTKHISVHVACGPRETESGRPFDRDYVAGFDFEALSLLLGHASRHDIRATVVSSYERTPREMAGIRVIDHLYPDGTHILLGSQLSNSFVERVVCLMYGVAPFDEAQRARFPYCFAWEHGAPSSFGITRAAEPGVIATQSGERVARREDREVGAGSDCGIVVSYRVPLEPKRQRHGFRVERTVIVCAGHGGPGTYACVRAITENPGAFYPPHPSQPWMRVVQAETHRTPKADAPRFDGREVVKVHVLEVA